jgi:hypothetical protein
LTVAGGKDSLFHRDAIALIHARSGGIPRLINQMCDLALVYAFAEQRQRVSAALVEKVLRDRSDGAVVKPLDSVAEGARPRAIPADGLAPPPRDDDALPGRA